MTLANISMTELSDFCRCSVFAYLRHEADAKTRKHHGILERWDDALRRLVYYLFHQVQGGQYPSAHLMKQAWGRIWAGNRTKEEVMFHVGSWRDEARKRERRGLKVALGLRDRFVGSTGTPILIAKAYELPFGKHVISGTIDLLREVDGQLEVIAFSTDDKPLSVYVQNDYALTGAAWAVRRLLGVKPDRVTLYHIPSGETYSAHRGKADFRLMHDVIDQVTQLKEAGIMYPALDANCIGCAYLGPCQKKEWLKGGD